MRADRFTDVRDPAFRHLALSDRIHVMVSESAEGDGSVLWRAYVLDDDGSELASEVGTAGSPEEGLVESQKRALELACRFGVFG